jgi:hypothetical protein
LVFQKNSNLSYLKSLYTIVTLLQLSPLSSLHFFMPKVLFKSENSYSRLFDAFAVAFYLQKQDSPRKVWHKQLMNGVTTRNSVICNHTLCNWDATACRMQLFLQLCPLFGCVCNYGATMITFIPTFG